MQLHFMKLLSKAPVRKPCWHSIRTKSINNICRANFITHRIKIKTHTRRNFRYLINGIIECLCIRQYHPSKGLFITSLLTENQNHYLAVTLLALVYHPPPCMLMLRKESVRYGGMI